MTIESRDPLRLLVIGAGRMGRVHLGAIEASGATTVAVVEPSLESRAQLDSSSVALFRELPVALAKGGFDAALIAVPSGLHLEIVSALMDAGVPTLCEKPCGLTVGDALEAAQRARDSNVLLQVGYWRRFVPELRDLRDEIASGALGDIALALAWQWDGEPPAPHFRRTSGGILIDMGVHEFDQLRWLTGQEMSLDSVVESSVFVEPYVEGDAESVMVSGRLSGGGVAGVSLGRRYDRGDSCWVEVIGTLGSRRCEFMVGPECDEVFQRALVAQIDAFAAAVAGEVSDGATADDAVTALGIAERGAALSPSNRPVDETTGETPEEQT
jgi:myo-inositol 2-dehydrogenase/D-chiro-inositol 1-dehydrogenase